MRVTSFTRFLHLTSVSYNRFLESHKHVVDRPQVVSPAHPLVRLRGETLPLSPCYPVPSEQVPLARPPTSPDYGEHIRLRLRRRHSLAARTHGDVLGLRGKEASSEGLRSGSAPSRRHRSSKSNQAIKKPSRQVRRAGPGASECVASWRRGEGEGTSCCPGTSSPPRVPLPRVALRRLANGAQLALVVIRCRPSGILVAI